MCVCVCVFGEDSVCLALCSHRFQESGRMYLMGIGVGDRPIVMSKVRGVKKQVSKINFEVIFH